MPGIRTSTSMRSGCSWAAKLTPSSPRAASPRNVNPGVASTTARTAPRNSAWSSTLTPPTTVNDVSAESHSMAREACQRLPTQSNGARTAVTTQAQQCHVLTASPAITGTPPTPCRKITFDAHRRKGAGLCRQAPQAAHPVRMVAAVPPLRPDRAISLDDLGEALREAQTAVEIARGDDELLVPALGVLALVRLLAGTTHG